MALTLFTALAFVMTLLGGLFPFSRAVVSRAGMWRLFALRAGILISVAFTEVLPEAWRQNPALAGWGAVAAFALLLVMGSFAMLDTCPEYLEECRVHYLGFTALLALTAHSLIDGFNLSISFGAGAAAGAAIGVALALHKLADGFTLMSLFKESGMSRRRSVLALAGMAAATPVGAALSATGFSGPSPAGAALGLGFAAGSFLYIGAADVLPRLHRSDDKACLAFFGGGLLGPVLLRML